MSEENKALIRRYIEELKNKENFSIIDELWTPDSIFHTPHGRDHGPEEFKKTRIAERKAFPDLRMEIDDIIAEGDKVVIRWTERGTFKAHWGNIPPTGEKIEISGIMIFRLSGGKIMEIWDAFDLLNMWQQLGVNPWRE